MYKKAGILITLIIVVLAVVVFLFASNAGKEKPDNGGKPTSQGEVLDKSTKGTLNEEISEPKTQVNGTVPPVIAPQVTDNEQTSAIVPEEDKIIRINVESLPEYTDSSDVGTVVGHQVYAYTGQVAYVLLINTTTNGQLKWFTTLTNYQIPEGTRVNCKVRTYKAQSGTFPAIITVSLAEGD